MVLDNIFVETLYQISYLIKWHFRASITSFVMCLKCVTAWCWRNCQCPSDWHFTWGTNHPWFMQTSRTHNPWPYNLAGNALDSFASWLLSLKESNVKNKKNYITDIEPFWLFPHLHSLIQNCLDTKVAVKLF